MSKWSVRTNNNPYSKKIQVTIVGEIFVRLRGQVIKKKVSFTRHLHLNGAMYYGYPPIQIGPKRELICYGPISNLQVPDAKGYNVKAA